MTSTKLRDGSRLVFLEAFPIPHECLFGIQVVPSSEVHRDVDVMADSRSPQEPCTLWSPSSSYVILAWAPAYPQWYAQLLCQGRLGQNRSIAAVFALARGHGSRSSASDR